MICARAEGKDSYNGDSGGPLIIKGEDDDNDILVGIRSFGVRCGRAQFPGVYTRISLAILWLKSVVCYKSDVVLSELQSYYRIAPKLVLSKPM